MGRQRKIPPPRRGFSVGDTQREAGAKLDLLQDMVEDMNSRRGRKPRVDHYEAAISVATALPREPESRRQKRRATLPSNRIGAKPVTTTAGIQLDGFSPARDNPKDGKQDMRAAQALQHTLAWRGEYITLSNAVKIMERARALLPKKSPIRRTH